MTQEQLQLHELLRSGLWGTPADPALFQGQVNWKAILRLAMEQTVQVIVADGIETLPAELYPPKELMFKLMAIRVKTKQLNLQLNSVLIKITRALTEAGLPSVLLKGQGLAHNYRLPESRMCGDIDLYVGMENFENACNTIASLSPIPQEEDLTGSEMHIHLELDGVTIEAHRKTTSSANKKQDKFIETWTREQLDAHFSDSTLPTILFDQTPVCIPSETYNAVFILHHAVRHLVTEGIGLRQICDWAMFLDKHHDKINEAEIRSTLRKLRMESVWAEFGILAVNHLGLDPRRLPLAPAKLTSKKTELLLHQIYAGGNFGHYDKDGRNPGEKNIMKRKWRSLCVQTQIFARIARIFPSFTLSYTAGWYPSALARLFRRK